MLVGFHDADELHIGPSRETRKNAQGVIVLETNDGDAHRRLCRLRMGIADGQNKGGEQGYDETGDGAGGRFHGSPISADSEREVKAAVQSSRGLVGRTLYRSLWEGAR